MAYFVFAAIGAAAGSFCVFMILEARRRAISEQAQQIALRSLELDRASEALQRRETAHRTAADALSTEKDRFERQFVAYRDLKAENVLLKQDMQNLLTQVRASELDHQQVSHRQGTLVEQINEIGKRYLTENVKWIGASLNQSNFVNCKKRLQDVIDRCRKIGFEISDSEESQLHADLKTEFARLVRMAEERAEQARIKAQIREEQKREREYQKEIERLDRERDAIRRALSSAMEAAHDQYSEEVERLKQRLAEAEERSQRAVSQAQLTKAGHVYVISNVGSFGEQIFKIGMTRRLEPEMRVRELGDASVPFPFDVHMMISSEDAPALENALHRKLHKFRLNKLNPRREFFKADVTSIIEIVKEHHGEIEYILDPPALEYRQSLEITDADQEFIESVYDPLTDDGEPDADEV